MSCWCHARRFHDFWGDSVFQDIRCRHVALTVGRFVRCRDVHTSAPRLQFELERGGPRYAWLQLLARFLERCAPVGQEFRSFLHPPPCDSTAQPCHSRRKLACASPKDAEEGQQPVSCAVGGMQSVEASSRLPAAVAAEQPAAPRIWVSLPPGFQPNPLQPHDATTGGYCVGHLARGAGVSACLLMSGAASSYYFELPKLQLALSTKAGEHIAEARLQLCHFRPVLQPGVNT